MSNPTITAEQAGVYRQIAHRIRVQGRVPEDSERPRSTRGAKRFLDLDSPTLITFAEGDSADVPRLLRMGAIVPWTAPAEPETTTSATPPLEDALVSVDELIDIVEKGSAAEREGRI